MEISSIAKTPTGEAGMLASTKPGYVYILQAKDIDLPICKIGMTTRTPEERCAELNTGATGDLLWTVFDALNVSDCQALESAVHRRLRNFRQPGREFFQLTPAQAQLEIQSTLEELADVRLLKQAEIAGPSGEKDAPGLRPKSKHKKSPFRQVDTQYADLLQSFSAVLGVKGRPFGQLNRQLFGISDGAKGVQWNLAIFTKTEEIWLGVNLEGLQYDSWPIATFILNETQNPQLEEVRQSVRHPDAMEVRFRRDAWQVTSRPRIVEDFLGGEIFSLANLEPPRWRAVLEEALDCLDAARDYRGRAHQEITLPANSKKPDRKVVMPVSPHLTVRTQLSPRGDHVSNITEAMDLLQPVYDWVKRQSETTTSV